MKKAAIGCVVLLVLLAGAAATASYVIYRKASSAVSGFAEPGFSLDEYRWVRAQAYAALGVPLMELDVSQIIADVQNGRTQAAPTAAVWLGPSGSAATRKLVEPYRKALEDYAPLAFFGL